MIDNDERFDGTFRHNNFLKFKFRYHSHGLVFMIQEETLIYVQIREFQFWMFFTAPLPQQHSNYIAKSCCFHKALSFVAPGLLNFIVIFEYLICLNTCQTFLLLFT